MRTMSIEQLDGNGNYVVADVSRFLFVQAGEVARWSARGEVYDAASLETSSPGMGGAELARLRGGARAGP